MAATELLLSVLSGGLVGLSLGLIGGGGSILAVPLMVYAVGVASPHVAVGTSGVALAASALFALAGHARAHTVTWPCAIVGKSLNGQALLTAFGILMIVIAISMLRPRVMR